MGLTLSELLTDARIGLDTGYLHADATVDSAGTGLGFVAKIVVADWTKIAAGKKLKFLVNNTDYYLTATAGVPTAMQFKYETDEATTATNIKNAINAYTALLAVLAAAATSVTVTVSATYLLLNPNDGISWDGDAAAILFTGTTKANWVNQITALGAAGGQWALCPPASSGQNAASPAMSFVAWILERFHSAAKVDATMKNKITKRISWDTSNAQVVVTYTVQLRGTLDAGTNPLGENLVVDQFS